MIKALLDFFICTTFERATFQIGSLGAGKLSDLGTQVCRAVPQNSTHCCNVAILGTVDTFGTEELLLDHKKSLGATSCQLPQFEKLGMILIKKTLPKALRTQALTALTSNFGLVGLVRWIRLGRFGL